MGRMVERQGRQRNIEESALTRIPKMEMTYVTAVYTSCDIVSYQDRPLVDGLGTKSVTWEGSVTITNHISNCSQLIVVAGLLSVTDPEFEK